MTIPYAVRKLIVTFELGTGSFGDSGFNQLTISGLRVQAQVQWANLSAQVGAQIRIYGMTLDQINQLSKAGTQYIIRTGDKVALQAGDDSGMTTVFNGTIIEAYPDFRDQPDVAFQVIASGGVGIQLKPVAPTTFNGPTPVAAALQQICQKAGLTLENNNVNAVLSYPYFPGTAMMQINRALRAADCFGVLDSMKSTLAIWPKEGGARSGSAQVSPDTGMIGYPFFERNFIRVRHLFNPEVYQGPGNKIQVESQLLAARGVWNIIQVDLNLASETPDGPWEMMIKAYSDKSGQSS